MRLQKGIYKEQGVLSKTLIFIGLLLMGFGISTIVGILLANPLFGINLMENQSALYQFDNPQSISALKFLQFLHSVGIFIAPPLAFAYLTTPDWKKYLQLNQLPASIFLVITLLIMVFALPWLNVIIVWNESMRLPEFLQGIESWMEIKENEAKSITEAFLQMDSFMTYVVNLILIGLIPAVGEELIFRGLIQRQIIRRTGNIHIGIWVAAILFSAIHLQFYGFIPRMMLGALFGYLLVWTGSLWIPIFAHFVNNAGAVTLQFFLDNEFTENELDTLGTKENDWVFLLVSALLLIGMIYYTRRINAGKK